MKKGLLYRAIVIILVCTMLFSLTGFTFVNPLSDDGDVEIQETTPMGEIPKADDDNPANPDDEKDMVKVTIDAEIKGGTVTCDDLPENGKVEKGTQLTFKATADKKGVISSELVGVNVNGKAIEVDKDGTFTVEANEDSTVSAEFFGLKSVTVDNPNEWTKSKTVKVETIGAAKATLEDANGKEVDFVISGNIDEKGEKYTVVVKSSVSTDVTPVTYNVTVRMIDNDAPQIEPSTTPIYDGKYNLYSATVVDDGCGLKEVKFQYFENDEWNDSKTTQENLKGKKETKIEHTYKSYLPYRIVATDMLGTESICDFSDVTAPVIVSTDISKGYKDENGVIWAGEKAILTVGAKDETAVTEIGIKPGDNALTQMGPLYTDPNDKESPTFADFEISSSGEYNITTNDGTHTNDSAEKITIKYDPDAPVITEARYNSATNGDNWLKQLLNDISGGYLFNEAFVIEFDVNDGEDDTEKNTFASGVKYAEYMLLEGKTSYTEEDIKSGEWKSIEDNNRSVTVKVTKDFSGCVVLRVWDKAGNSSAVVVGFTEENASHTNGKLITNKATINDTVRVEDFNPMLTVMATTKTTNEEGKEITSAHNGEKWEKSVDFEIGVKLPDNKEETVERAVQVNDANGNLVTETITIKIEYSYSVVGIKETHHNNFTGKDEENEISYDYASGGLATYNIGDNNKQSFEGDVKFTLTYKKIATNIDEHYPNVDVDDLNVENDTYVVVPAKIQNYLNPAYVYVVREGVEGETTVEPDKTNGWYNGSDNVLKGINIKGCKGSTAPAWTYYKLSYKDVNGNNEDILVAVTNNEEDNVIVNKNTFDVFENYINKTGYYTLEVWSEDAAGNKVDAAKYIFKYDTVCPQISASFTAEPVFKNGYFMLQRVVTISITDEAFMGNEDEKGRFNIKFAPEIGNEPVVSTDWIYTPYKEKDSSGGKWSIDYTCGDEQDSGTIGDNYNLTVSVKDNANNESSTDTSGILTTNGNTTQGVVYYEGEDVEGFNIDQKKPEVSVVFDNNAALNSKYFASGRTATITVTEHNFDPNRVEMTATNATSGEKANDGWEQSTSNKDVWTKVVEFNPQDAVCEFNISVTDKAGNTCNTTEVNYNGSVSPNEFVIDQVNPDLSITGTNATPYADDCTPGFSGHDTNMSAEYTMTLTRTVRASRNENVSDKFLNRGSVSVTGTDINAVFNTLTKEAENDGIYILDVTITDMAGNSTRETSTFTVNRNGSFYIFNDELSDVVNARFVKVADGKYQVTEYNASPLVNGSVKIEIYRDGQLVNTLTPKTGAGSIGASGLYEYTYDLPANNFEQDGRYKIAITSEDEAKNKSDSTKLEDAAIEFVVDSVDPEIVMIKGLEDRIVNAKTLNVSANAIDTYGIASIKIVVDGKAVKEYVTQEAYDKIINSGKKLDHEYAVLTDMLDFTAEYILLESSDNQTIEFIVTDMAGNSTTTNTKDFAPSYDFHDTVLVSTSFWARYIHNVWAIIATVAVIAAAGAASYFLFVKKRKAGEKETAA